MLYVNTTLPAGAVLGETRAAFLDTLAPAGAVWFQGQPDRFDLDGETVTGWHSNTGTAQKTEPNSGNTTLSGYAARLQAEMHCGFAMPRITDHAAQFTMAVIYSGDDPRTLLTLNTTTPDPAPDVANYLFISHVDGALTVKDTQDGIGLTAPAPHTADRHLAVVTLSGNRLAMAQGLHAPVSVKGTSIGFQHPADLFIGCRSHRKGLLKTLGNACIHDVLFWPNHTLLLPRGAADVAQYTALKQFYLWDTK